MDSHVVAKHQEKIDKYLARPCNWTSGIVEHKGWDISVMYVFYI